MLRLFVTSVAGFLVFVALAYVPDPKMFGITEEPSRILYYWLAALFAALRGIATLVSGALLAVRRLRGSVRDNAPPDGPQT